MKVSYLSQCFMVIGARAYFLFLIFISYELSNPQTYFHLQLQTHYPLSHLIHHIDFLSTPTTPMSRYFIHLPLFYVPSSFPSTQTDFHFPITMEAAQNLCSVRTNWVLSISRKKTDGCINHQHLILSCKDDIFKHLFGKFLRICYLSCLRLYQEVYYLTRNHIFKRHLYFTYQTKEYYKNWTIGVLQSVWHYTRTFLSCLSLCWRLTIENERHHFLQVSDIL